MSFQKSPATAAMMAWSLRRALPRPSQIRRSLSDVVQSLQFRRADRHVTEILREASNEVWEQLARESYPDALAEPQLQKRLMEMRKTEAARLSDPLRSLGASIAQKTDDPAVGARVVEILRSKDFPIKDNNAGHTIHRAYEAYPNQVAEALVSRVAQGLEVPYNAHEYLLDAPMTDDGPIVAVALSDASQDRLRQASLAIVGPKTVGRLIDELLALDEDVEAKGPQLDEATRKKYASSRNRVGNF
jgi:hypothetical protein